MTDQDLAAIEYRISKATPGPWRVDEDKTYDPQEVGICADHGDPRLGLTQWDSLICCFGLDEQPHRGHAVALANAEFIAHARTDIGLLLSEVRRLQGELTATRRASAESMRTAIVAKLRHLWDQGAANVAAAVPVPDSL